MPTPTSSQLPLYIQQQIIAVYNYHLKLQDQHDALTTQMHDAATARIDAAKIFNQKREQYKNSCKGIANFISNYCQNCYLTSTQFRYETSGVTIYTYKDYPILRDIINRLYVYKYYTILENEQLYYQLSSWYNTFGKTEQDEDSFESILGHPKKATSGNYGSNYFPSYTDNVSFYCKLFYPNGEVIEQPISGYTRNDYKAICADETADGFEISSITNNYQLPIYNFIKGTVPFKLTEIQTNLNNYTNQSQEQSNKNIQKFNLKPEFKNEIVNAIYELSSQIWFKQQEKAYRKNYNDDLNSSLTEISNYQKSNSSEILAYHDSVSSYVNSTYLSTNFGIYEKFKDTITEEYKTYKKTYPIDDEIIGYSQAFINLSTSFSYDNYFTNQ